MTTTVVNLRHDKADIIIDRRSQWGNPFKIGSEPRYITASVKAGMDRGEWPQKLTREGVVDQYAIYLAAELDQDPDWLEPLRGQRLGCWCKPLACHGDLIVEMLESAHE